jgi:putative DNA primase/helicase
MMIAHRPKESAATLAGVSGGIQNHERSHYNLTASQRQRAAMVPCDPVAGLLDAMLSAGIRPVDAGAIVADGVLRRFDVEGDRRGSRNGWAVLYHDHGAGGSWKTGVSCAWSSKSTARMTRQEKDLFYRQMRAAKAEAQRQRDAEHAAAAERASMLWDKAKPATAQHAYLVRKRIAPGNARQTGELLVLKIEDVNGNTRSLQYIGPDGTKRMLTGGAKKGHFIIVQGALPADLIVIAEGFATASTAATQFPGAAVLAAIDAGNLEPVALAIRSKHPAAEIVVCADDDRQTFGNPGLTKARAAAAAVHGKLVRPIWPDGAPESLTDLNDLAVFMEVSA